MTFKIGRDSNGVIAYTRNFPKRTFYLTLTAEANTTVVMPDWVKTVIFSSTGSGTFFGIREGNADISAPTGTATEATNLMLDPSGVEFVNLGGQTINLYSTVADTVTIKGTPLYTRGGIFSRNSGLYGETPPSYKGFRITTESGEYITANGNYLTAQ